MQDRLIVDQTEFDELCAHIKSSGIVAFDTEFVSEHTYRPDLCLLQFATSERCVAVDPFEVKNLEAWWKIMADEETTVVIHGGREEVRFCWYESGTMPRKIVDVQIAEGMKSRGFPISYTALIDRILKKKTHGKETRTDWRRRPLTDHQISYALEDVEHLLAVWKKQTATLEKLNRMPWSEDEFQRMISEVKSELTGERWRRLSGLNRLGARELAMVSELFAWRDQETENKNRPARRILRDDLLVDLARRQPKTMSQLLATRDMNRSDYKKNAQGMLDCIARAAEIPKSEYPKPTPRASTRVSDDEQVLGKFLGIALANRCAELEIAMSLVGTTEDLRHLVRWHVYKKDQGEPPALMRGWREDVCGDLLRDVLDGKVTIRVADPESDHPLKFEHDNDG